MPPSSKLRKAIGAMKDQTSIGLAKVNSSTSLADLEVAIVKATRHEEYPPDERHIREILSQTSYSRTFVSACVDTISRRLNKTKNWVVAVKSLILVHRLLLDGDPAYHQEIFFATRRGTRLLNMSDFRDSSRSNSWEYSAFVRSFALYLDEYLEFRMQGRRGKRGAYGFEFEDEADDGRAGAEAGPSPPRRGTAKTTPVREMTMEHLFSRLQHLMLLMDRFLACRPTGSARFERLVLMALYPVVKESFQIYYDMVEIQRILIDRFEELEVPYCVRVHDTFCRLAKQFDELDAFYAWSKEVGVARSSEYPEIEKLTQKKLDVMYDFIRDKSSNNFIECVEEEPQEPEEEEKKSEVIEEDMNTIKALPAAEEVPEPVEEPEEEEKKEDSTQKEADLLNLGEDAVTSEEHSEKLALALFDGIGSSEPSTTTTAWEAFKGTENWETALVQSASHLSNQKVIMPGGFDMMTLNGMYRQGSTAQAMSGYGATGSASSMAFGSAGRPAALALPAPPDAEGGEAPPGSDPFAASLEVPPPSYVQMSDMEKKQRLLVEEQTMWQQFARDGRQGHVALNQNPYPYHMGGYTRTC